MTKEQKAIIMVGLLQLLTEYAEELYESKAFRSVFVRELKRDCKQFLKSSEKIINAISDSGNDEVNEQIVDVYKLVGRLAEEHIEWEKV